MNMILEAGMGSIGSLVLVFLFFISSKKLGFDFWAVNTPPLRTTLVVELQIRGINILSNILFPLCNYC